MKNLLKLLSIKFKKFIYNEEGVTLIELIIVIAILAILGAFVVPKLSDIPDKAKINAAKLDISKFETILDARYFSKFPTTEEGLQKVIDDGFIKKKKSALEDPWGNPYQYRSPGESGNEYEIWSLGADGKEGGEGSDADIKSWE